MSIFARLRSKRALVISPDRIQGLPSAARFPFSGGGFFVALRALFRSRPPAEFFAGRTGPEWLTLFRQHKTRPKDVFLRKDIRGRGF